MRTIKAVMMPRKKKNNNKGEGGGGDGDKVTEKLGGVWEEEIVK